MRGSITSAPFFRLKDDGSNARTRKINEELESTLDPYTRNKLMEQKGLQDIYGGIGAVYSKYRSPY